MKYRPEIDGLRALAVIPVILFHAGFEHFRGGFVGVDVFFVISGYLITSILIESIEDKRFSIVAFYERRARRILPALFVVMLACLPFSWLWMLPGQFKDFSESLVAVSAFASNILFLLESDYFGGVAEEKPLLHTWSLAVEEQYYLVFPIFMLLAWRRCGRQGFFWLIAALTLASLTVSEWTLQSRPSASFYLAHTRAWELFAGSLACFFTRRHGIRAHDGLALAGLAAILLAVFLYGEETPFPGLSALLPVGGTCLLITCAGRGSFVTGLLGNRALVGIGLISYSAYLWHQPLFAFARVMHIDEPGAALMSALALLSMLLAWLSWKYIETPFRSTSAYSRRFIFTGSALFIALFGTLGLAGHLFYAELRPGQFNALNLSGLTTANKILQDQSWEPLRELSGNSDYEVSGNAYDRENWFGAGAPHRRLVIVGNSHSKDLYNILLHSESVRDSFLVTRYGAQIRHLDLDHRFWRSANYRLSSTVVIASQYSEEDIAKLPAIAGKLSREGKQLVLVKNIHEFRQFRNGHWSLIDRELYRNRDSGLTDKQLAALINESYYRAYRADVGDRSVVGINARIDSIGSAVGASVLDRMDYACNDEKQLCYAVDEKLNKLYYDYGHHTLDGARFFARRVDELAWFPPGT